MGGTLARVAAKSSVPKTLLLSSRTKENAERLSRELNCTAADNQTLAAQADMLVLGVKPQNMREVLQPLIPVLAKRTDRFVLVSMAAGLKMEALEEMAGGIYPLLRIMPNTPALVGKGSIPYCKNEAATQEDCHLLEELFAPAGLVLPMDEGQLDAAGALSGCGPAFVYIYMEALADAGVSCGLPRELALQLAAQTVAGAGEMVLRTGTHPAALKDAVCSPGGSTIAGVYALEQDGLRAAAHHAVRAAFQRSKELGK